MPQLTSAATAAGVLAAGVVEAVVSVAGVADVVDVASPPELPHAASNKADNKTHG